jgi:5,10-methylene-tetrahydrofolate dehydrogenase/methenyl tetrahydrofolate cyclohydrolase
MVKDDGFVIDVGITRVDETKEKGYVITGDVDFENVSKKASFITLFLEDDDSDVIKKIRCWQEK